ncbi:hypothetical protein HYX05_03670 [Candidatus Woesearchaeota archaeon]|nr:hypothetical protein [Candidatus Woesearchaeota archaeon]
MAGAISENHLGLNESLARESNRLAKSFNPRQYSKIKNIDGLLLKKNSSVEKKKRMLVNELHNAVLKAFSIEKKNFGKKELGSLKKRLHAIRRLIIKLRGINYYLETAFLHELKIPKMKAANGNSKLRHQNSLAKDELEILEYTAYSLIRKVVSLDKRLLKEYSSKEMKVIGKEKIEAKDIGIMLKKESELLEHMEAKLPPPKAATLALMKEPIFTHWVSRIFALLSYLEHICNKEAMIFGEIKSNRLARSKINRKISYLMGEKAKLVRVLQEKAASMKKFGTNSKLKAEMHNLTATMGL